VASYSVEQITPLLLELARACRARRFYAPGHPALRDVIDHASRVWRGGLGADELVLELRRGVFALPDGPALEAPGVDEVAMELCRHRARRLRVHPGVGPADLAALVDALCEEPAEDGGGHIEGSLARAGVLHLTTGELDFAELSGRAPEAAGGPAVDGAESATSGEPPPAPVALEEESDPAEALRVLLSLALAPLEPDCCSADPPVEQTGPAQSASPLAVEPAPRALLAAGPARPGDEPGEVDELDAVLQELEVCDDALLYAGIALRAAETAARLLAEGRSEESYSVLLRLARHANDKDRPPTPRETAREHVAYLLEEDAMLDVVLAHTTSESALGNVRATEVLMCVGDRVAHRLLEAYVRAEAELRRRISSVLIALGDMAFPLLIDELASPRAVRVRRAARILGDMQNPRGVEFLIDRLAHPELPVKKEVALALARIGIERAVEGLIAALQSDEETARIAAAALGGTRSDAPVAALIALAEPASRCGDDLRREAIRSLGRLGCSEAVPALSRVLEHRPLFGRRRSRDLRVAAAHALGRIGGEDASNVLTVHAERGEGRVRQACAEALRLLAAGPRS
jgi:hypothetical protein